MIDWNTLKTAPRILVEVSLKPAQGSRFQPTGFPDLGAAEYQLYDGTGMILVESAQSMANRMETACWDEASGKPVSALDGLPYVHVSIGGTQATASVLEAHRLNSPYVLQGMLGNETFKDVLTRDAEYREGQPIDRAKFLKAVFKYDPASLVHGLFMSNVGDGRLRLARAASAFIEARNVGVAQSGGVKNDRVNPSGEPKEGYGNVPFARTEYTAETITAYFNLDLRQVRGYGLGDEATHLLTLLALYKFARLAEGGMRLRTACDLVSNGVTITAPVGITMPPASEIEAALRQAIHDAQLKGLFANPAVTQLSFTQTEASGKAAKKAAKKDKGEASP